MRPRLFLLLLAVLSASCSFRGDYVDGFQCGEGDRCPAGQTCSGGVCVAVVEPDGGGPGPDPGGDGSVDPTAPRCGGLTLLQDDFESTLRKPWTRVAEAGVTASITGGAAVVSLTAGSANVRGSFESTQVYDLRGAAFEVEVVQVGGVSTEVEVRAYTGETARMAATGGTLIATVGGTMRASRVYSAAEQRYWRLREDAGELYWEFSADRAVWTELHHEPTPVPPEHVRGVLAARGQLAAASVARFDNVNVTPPDGTPGFCAGATLVDDFSAGGLAPLWYPNWFSSQCTTSEADGAVRFSFTGWSADVWCGVATEHLYDLTESTVVLDMADAAQAGGYQTYFQLESPDDHETVMELLYVVNRDEITAAQYVDGTMAGADATVAHDPTAHRYWRFRGAGGRIHMETSPDGTAWTLLYEGDPIFDLSRVLVTFSAGHYANMPGPELVTFPGINLL